VGWFFNNRNPQSTHEKQKPEKKENENLFSAHIFFKVLGKSCTGSWLL